MKEQDLKIKIKVSEIMKTTKRAPRKEIPLHEYEELKSKEIELSFAKGAIEIQSNLHSAWMNRAQNKIDKLNQEKQMYMWLFFLSVASMVGVVIYEYLK